MSEAMAALRAEIAVGRTVKITDHDCLSGSRDNATVAAVHQNGLILRPKRGWPSQGRGYLDTALTWDGDMEVTGRTVHLYRTPPPHTGKTRRLIKTYTFAPPSLH